MKKYLSGGWAVLKNYIFAMIFFYIFFIGFYTKASLFSILIFIVMITLIYYELVHRVGVDKRRYGVVKPIDGVIYALYAITPMILLQIVILFLDLNIPYINFEILKVNLIKGLVAPMLFIAKLGGYKLPGYIAAWGTIVLIAYLGYLSGYKDFDLNAFVRRLFGLQPRKKPTTNKKRRFW